MNLPIPEYGKTDKETLENLMDTVAKLRKELEYMLLNLGDENIPELSKTKDAIKNIGDTVELKIDSNTVISAINVSTESAKIAATKINLVNAVEKLSSISQNLGDITAAHIDIADDIAIGKMLILKHGGEESGIAWDEASIKYNPTTKAINITAPGGVFVNGTQI